MRNIGISAVVAVALSSSLVMANDALEEAFKNGSSSGNFGVFAMHKKHKIERDSRDGKRQTYTKEGFASGFVEIGYQSAPLYGVSVGASVFGITKLADSQMAYKEDIKGDALLHKRFIQIANERVGSMTYGRQGVNLEWLTDYIDGVVIALTPIEELAVVLGWAKHNAVVAEDELSEKFEPMNDNKGVYVVDAKYTLGDMLTFNPYFYHIPDVLSAPGLKVEFNYDLGGGMSTSTMAQYVAVKVEDKKEDGQVIAEGEDGSLMWIEQGFSFGDASVALGFIKTDKEAGVGAIKDNHGFKGIASFGDQNPFEEGNQVYGKDAKSLYLSLGYKFEGLKLGMLYGETKFASAYIVYDSFYGNPIGEAVKSQKEREIDVSLGYEVLKNLETSLVYANVKNDKKTDGKEKNAYSVAKFLASYSF